MTQAPGHLPDNDMEKYVPLPQTGFSIHPDDDNWVGVCSTAAGTFGNSHMP